MPKSKVKEGKKRRRGKNENDIMKRELVKKDGDNQAYAQVVKMLGNGRLTAFCFDGKIRLCHIRRGKLRKNGWINTGDIILIRFRGYQHDKGVADVILKYTPDEARILKNSGQLPESTKLNDEVDEQQNEGKVEFKCGMLLFAIALDVKRNKIGGVNPWKKQCQLMPHRELRCRLEFAQTEEIGDGQVCGCATRVKASEIWVCNDVWMDILPSFDHAQLGLNLALLSCRFDALVDKHFGTTELTIWNRIRIVENIGSPIVSVEHIDGQIVEFPLPDRPLPNKIRFHFLLIAYIDHSVITFLSANKPIWDKSGTKFEFVPWFYKIDQFWDVFARQLCPIFTTSIRHLEFYSCDDLDDLLRHTSPTFLTDLDQLNSIDGGRLFPDVIADDGPNATSAAGHALSKWVHTPTKNGQSKRLRCEDFVHPQNLEWINSFKERFLRATTITTSASYKIRFGVWRKSTPIEPFELVNERTNEQLTLMRKENGGGEFIQCLFKRCPIIMETAAQKDENLDNDWKDENLDHLNGVYFRNAPEKLFALCALDTRSVHPLTQ
ncbi:hypothetical protein niasHS_005458 [Heterodera schachtii]|uniref:S1-like domain-containing protein n=1 Tax=Heterodera schachtii TaxID=97005 RepID=A0ABD2JIV0_HETSC